MGLLVLLFAKKVHFSIPPHRFIAAATGWLAEDITNSLQMLSQICERVIFRPPPYLMESAKYQETNNPVFDNFDAYK
jgi:protein involved in sex pheromone biosynthesis